MSEVVRFRMNEEALEYLRERGVNPNRFAREAFDANLRRMRAEETVEQLDAISLDLPRPIVDLIREDRDRRAASSMRARCSKARPTRKTRKELGRHARSNHRSRRSSVSAPRD